MNHPYWTIITVVLEQTLESPLDSKEIQLDHSEGDQPWDFFGRNDAKAETPVLWPPHVKGWLIGKDSDAGRDWGQEEKGTTEDEMAGWHHQLDGHESEWTPGVGDGQGGLACCDSWGRRVGHDWVTELSWTELKPPVFWFLDSTTSSNFVLCLGNRSSGRVWLDHQNESLGSYKTFLICFPSITDTSPEMPVVRHLKNYHIYFSSLVLQ